ncbi:YfeC-like transcriptional regulator, partial [Klebsiella michiganensis]
MHLMTPAEQLHLRDFLAREGLSGFLSRLGITDAK